MSSSNRQQFLETCGIPQSTLETLGIDWRSLFEIYSHHLGNKDELTNAGNSVLDLLRHAPGVHSVRMRVKGPCRLVQKIIRKISDNPDRHITPANYRQEITDLVGIRALHLFKEDWRDVHDFVESRWIPLEQPVAYIRKGDPVPWTDQFKAKGCRVQEHPRSYRSVHYLLPTAVTKEPTTVEVQVRTLLEEAWSEIDHRINYPERTEHAMVRLFLEIFNRLAGNADEMGSFVNSLEREMSSQHMIDLEQDRRELFSNVMAILGDAKLSDQQRARVETSLHDLLAKSRPASSKPFAPDSLTLLPLSITPQTSAVQYLAEIASAVQLSEALGRLRITRQCEVCGEPLIDHSSNAAGTNRCPQCAPGPAV